jgi:hypothetical protein
LPCVKAEIRPASPSQYAWPSVLRAAARPKSRFGMLSALRAHTKAPYKTDLLWKTLRALNRPWAARTVPQALHDRREQLLGVRHQPQSPACSEAG